MSDHEQDATIGRLIREHAERRKKLIIMTAELERLAGTFSELGSNLKSALDAEGHLVTAQSFVDTSPTLTGFGLAKVSEFLAEYGQLRKAVAQGQAWIRDIGIY